MPFPALRREGLRVVEGWHPPGGTDSRWDSHPDGGPPRSRGGFRDAHIPTLSNRSIRRAAGTVVRVIPADRIDPQRLQNRLPDIERDAGIARCRCRSPRPRGAICTHSPIAVVPQALTDPPLSRRASIPERARTRLELRKRRAKRAASAAVCGVGRQRYSGRSVNLVPCGGIRIAKGRLSEWAICFIRGQFLTTC